jgi:hypothetical protein
VPSPDLFRRGGSSRKTAANRRVRMQPTAPAVGGTGRSRPAPAGETSALSGSGACWFDQNPDGLDHRQCRVIVLGKLSNLAQNRWRRCVIVGQSKMRNRGAPESSGVLEIWLRLPLSTAGRFRRVIPCFSSQQLRIAQRVSRGRADGRTRKLPSLKGTTEHVMKNYVRDRYNILGFSNRVEIALWCVKNHKELAAR